MDRALLSKAQRADLARRLAEERLTTVNQKCASVHLRVSFYTRFVKRAIDIAVSLLALTVTLPINLVIGVITYFDVGRPIFFTQDRIGKDGKLFKIVNLRWMKIIDGVHREYAVNLPTFCAARTTKRSECDFRHRCGSLKLIAAV